jgi:putative peptidoglycan lipid II flippase
MAATLTSRLLGVVRTRILAQVFGSGSTADVINFTFNIPNNFRKLFGEGAVNSALIPAFSALSTQQREETRHHLFSLLCTYQLILFIPIVIISYIWREGLIALLSNFDRTQIALGGQLLPPFMLYLLFISLGAIFGGVLQSHHRFSTAYLSPLIFSLVVIAGVLTLTPRLGALSMAVSAVAGGLGQAAVTYLAVRRHGYRMRIAIQSGDTPLFSVLRAWLLVSVGMVAQVIAQLVTYRFASALPTGSVTALANSTIFYQTPYGIFFNAISGVCLPILATAHALGQTNRIKEVTSGALTGLGSLLIPSTIILFFLSRESVSAILQAGLFSHDSALLTAKVLRGYLLFMTPLSFYALMLRLGYSASRHRTMTMVVVLQNVLDIALMWVFIKGGVGILSLPLANGISAIGAFIALAILLRDLYAPHRDRRLFAVLLRICVANLPVLCAALIYRRLGPTWYASGSNLRNVVMLGALGLGALLLTLASYRIMNIPLTGLLRGRGEGDGA